MAGNCEWIYTFSAAISVELTGVPARIADALRLVEQVDPAGAYPYLTFDGLTFQGNFVRNDLTDETITY